MHVTTPPKKNKQFVVVGPLDISRIGRGILRQSGAGCHKDRRTKRNRTRSQQRRSALSDC